VLPPRSDSRNSAGALPACTRTRYLIDIAADGGELGTGSMPAFGDSVMFKSLVWFPGECAAHALHSHQGRLATRQRPGVGQNYFGDSRRQRAPLRCMSLIFMVARGGIEPPTRGFSGGFRGSGGLRISHLQRLPAPIPASPGHIPGTLNLSSTRSRHKGPRQGFFATTLPFSHT
jgi:hypothetical protein